MSVELKVRADYELGAIKEIADISTSNDCYLVVTDEGNFVFKQAGRLDFVKAYDKAVDALQAQGLTAARLVRTRQGALMTEQGYSLTEYIPGDTPEAFDDSQFVTAVRYISRYNRALQAIPFSADELLSINVWDQAKSTEFLCEHFQSLITRCRFSIQDEQILNDAGKLLVENRSFLQGNRKQLIHTDLGPGNLVFSNGQVKTIIDFTPEYENELYSLAQFLFWTCLLKQTEPAAIAQTVHTVLMAYYGTKSVDGLRGSQQLFVYLLKACLFRLAGPILNMLEQGSCDTTRLGGRIRALRNLFAVQPLL